MSDEPLCTRPINSAPDETTMAECILSGKCGCTVAGHEHAQRMNGRCEMIDSMQRALADIRTEVRTLRMLVDQIGALSVRDEFAAAALAGIAAHNCGPEKKPGETAPQAHARWAFVVADAMIAIKNSTGYAK